MTYLSKGNPDKLNIFLEQSIPAALQAADNEDLKPLKALHIATQTPVYRYAGWGVAFHAYMRRFWVKTRDCGIIEVYSLNKTDVRKAFNWCGIREIFEVPQVSL